MRFIIDTTNKTIEPRDKDWDFYTWLVDNFNDPTGWTIVDGNGKI